MPGLGGGQDAQLLGRRLAADDEGVARVAPVAGDARSDVGDRPGRRSRGLRFRGQSNTAGVRSTPGCTRRRRDTPAGGGLHRAADIGEHLELGAPGNACAQRLALADGGHLGARGAAQRLVRRLDHPCAGELVVERHEPRRRARERLAHRPRRRWPLDGDVSRSGPTSRATRRDRVGVLRPAVQRPLAARSPRSPCTLAARLACGPPASALTTTGAPCRRARPAPSPAAAERAGPVSYGRLEARRVADGIGEVTDRPPRAPRAPRRRPQLSFVHAGSQGRYCSSIFVGRRSRPSPRRDAPTPCRASATGVASALAWVLTVEKRRVTGLAACRAPLASRRLICRRVPLSHPRRLPL